MSLWIPITVAAAFFQNLRFMLQKRLKDRLSTSGVTLSRFLYAAPMAWLVVAGLVHVGGLGWPGLTPRFLLFGALGGLAQIVATAMLIALFSHRNFAVGITFVKTETVMTAVLSGLILGEFVGPGGAAAILVTALGVVVMSRHPAGPVLAGLLSKPALMGIGSGLVFSFASIAYRAASLALAEGDFLIRAAVSLAMVTSFQTLALGAWTMVREPGQIALLIRNWRICSWVGLTSMLGTLAWFSAFTLQNAAYVKALGQIELLFSLLTSRYVFGEQTTRAELLGMLLVVAGIVVLVLV